MCGELAGRKEALVLFLCFITPGTDVMISVDLLSSDLDSLVITNTVKRHHCFCPECFKKFILNEAENLVHEFSHVNHY